MIDHREFLDLVLIHSSQHVILDGDRSLGTEYGAILGAREAIDHYVKFNFPSGGTEFREIAPRNFLELHTL